MHNSHLAVVPFLNVVIPFPSLVLFVFSFFYAIDFLQKLCHLSCRISKNLDLSFVSCGVITLFLCPLYFLKMKIGPRLLIEFWFKILHKCFILYHIRRHTVSSGPTFHDTKIHLQVQESIVLISPLKISQSTFQLLIFHPLIIVTQTIYFMRDYQLLCFLILLFFLHQIKVLCGKSQCPTDNSLVFDSFLAFWHSRMFQAARVFLTLHLDSANHPWIFPDQYIGSSLFSAASGVVEICH